jgi:hypothetical protein
VLVVVGNLGDEAMTICVVCGEATNRGLLAKRCLDCHRARYRELGVQLRKSKPRPLCIICGSPAGNGCTKTCGTPACRRTLKAQRAASEESLEKKRARARARYWRDPDKGKKISAEWRKNNPDKRHLIAKRRYARIRSDPVLFEKERLYRRKYREKVSDLVAVLRAENPDLLKEFGL